MATLDSMPPTPGNERAAAPGGDHPGHAAAAELLACCGAPQTMRGAFVDPGGDLPQAQGRGRAGRGHDREDPADPRPYRPLRLAPASSPRSSACRSKARTRTTASGSTGWPRTGRRYGDRRPAVRAAPLAGRRRHGHASASSPSTSATAPATRPATSSSTIRESKLALVGDVLFKGSIGRWDFPARQPAAADRFDHPAAVADGRRDRLRARPRADVDLRPRTRDQSLRRRRRARRGLTCNSRPHSL